MRDNEKPIAMFYEGHDATLSIYIPKTNEWVIYELERLSQRKHYGFMRPTTNTWTVYKNYRDLYSTSWGEANGLIKFCIKNLEKDFGIENDFQELIIKPLDHTLMHEHRSWDYGIINAPKWQKTKIQHHEAHSRSAYIQSPFDKAVCIAWDGGGDNTDFTHSEFANNTIGKITEYRNFQCGWVWNTFAIRMETIRGTPHIGDYAGKVMGLSAYGKKYKERAEKLVPKMISFYARETNIGDKYTHYRDKVMKPIRDEIESFMLEEFDKQIVDGEDEKLLAYVLQLSMERFMIDLIRNEFFESIVKHDNNLIITGGSAMNILVNELVKKEFPDMNVFVPCNPGDSGLSQSYFVVHDKHDFKYAGPYLFDHNELPRYRTQRKTREVSLSEVANLLRQGKIIGFLNGRSEIGPRSLGNRSILCDPSIPGMKDILNAKVKFREWYRPFAPMCRLEDADKYFDSRDYELMDAMQFGIDVRPEWQEHLTEITHEDGSARLQTVTEKSNSVIYELLSEFDGVLLNTSFNVQGKPILNSIRDALQILDNTELDFIVIVDKETNQPILFE